MNRQWAQHNTLRDASSIVHRWLSDPGCFSKRLFLTNHIEAPIWIKASSGCRNLHFPSGGWVVCVGCVAVARRHGRLCWRGARIVSRRYRYQRSPKSMIISSTWICQILPRHFQKFVLTIQRSVNWLLPSFEQISRFNHNDFKIKDKLLNIRSRWISIWPCATSPSSNQPLVVALQAAFSYIFWCNSRTSDFAKNPASSRIF